MIRHMTGLVTVFQIGFQITRPDCFLGRFLIKAVHVPGKVLTKDE